MAVRRPTAAQAPTPIWRERVLMIGFGLLVALGVAYVARHNFVAVERYGERADVHVARGLHEDSATRTIADHCAVWRESQLCESQSAFMLTVCPGVCPRTACLRPAPSDVIPNCAAHVARGVYVRWPSAWRSVGVRAFPAHMLVPRSTWPSKPLNKIP